MRQDHRPEAIDPVPAALGALAERYEVERKLGRGGMSVVYLARERRGGRRVTIKLISAHHSGNDEAVRRFAREARMVAVLQHPNIVRTLAIEELRRDTLAIVSAFVPGDTLRAALRATGPFPFDRAAGVLRDVAAALAHAHERRIVHRDVKPENILLVGTPGRALLADFGIARELDSDTMLTAEGSAIGTPTYMAPEQVDGSPVDERTDIYALGLVGWEMLAGERPWQGESLYSVLYKQKHELLPSLAALRPDIPAYLLAAIEGAILKDPARRWQSAEEMLRRLTPVPVRPVRAAASGGDDATTSSMATPRASRRVTARLAWALAGLVAAAAVVLVALARSDRDAPAGTARLDSELAGALERAAMPTPAPATSTSGEAPPSAAPRPSAPTAASARATRGATAPAARQGARCESPAAADQRACLLALIARQDVALDDSYGTLIAELRRRAGGTREPPPVRALRTEQRAWLATRDSTCRAEDTGAGAGHWGVRRAPCFARLSSEREAELRARLARLRAGGG